MRAGLIWARRYRASIPPHVSCYGSIPQHDPHDFIALLVASCVARRPADRGRAGGRASARLGDDEERARLRARTARVTGVRHAWTFDDMFSTFATQGLDAKEKGEFTREELAPLAEVNVDLAEGIRLSSPTRKANGKKVEFDDAGRTTTGSNSKDDAADAALHAAAQDAGEGQGPRARNLRSGLFRRLRLRREGPGQARRRAGGSAS